MKRKMVTEIAVPEGIECKFENGIFSCKKGSAEASKKINIPGIKVQVASDKISLICEKGNKKDGAVIGANESHIKNLIRGLDEKYSYELEICYVHFPITVKIEKNQLVIDNFLGEKFKRKAKIVEGTEVSIEGSKIIVSAYDLEAAGQTAANIEKATKVPKKDRRIFQDGIFITSKGGMN